MKNDFLTLIKTRRSIRAYKPDAVPADTLARVLEAGTYAPSAMGEQSATIVAVETKAYRDRLTKLNAAVIGRDVDPYYGAPVIVVVLGDGERANYLAEGSCVLENLMLAAHAEGLGTVWVNREREIFDSPDGKALLCDRGFQAVFSEYNTLPPEQRGSLAKAVFQYWFRNSAVLEALVQIHRTDILFDSLRRSSGLIQALRPMADDPARFDYFVAIITSSMIGVLTVWVEHGKTETDDQMVQKLTSAFIEMAILELPG